MFVFTDFNVHHKDWETFIGETDRPGELCFKCQTTLLRWLIFLHGSLIVTRNPVPLDLLLPSDDIFCSRVDFSTLGNFDYVFVLAVSFRKK